eukprot:TRINITY_DN2693_c0_g3_i1.p1 TRINITY_DN2693_c0_g3~~TRINITY_DN2693_c0_g3_i1.p1  ORF type:complete len:575 (-),score=174.24 TRINITY_DN2693_c0_g3_i1:49-1728(-)
MAKADIETLPMFCFQCEQTAHQEACTIRGVCSKDAEIAGMQDHIVFGTQAVASIALRCKKEALPAELYDLVTRAMFSTLTNVNFSPDDHVRMIRDLYAMKELLLATGPEHMDAVPSKLSGWKPGEHMTEMLEQARTYLIPKRVNTLGKDRICLQELSVYGLKGLCAYLYHAMELGKRSDEVFHFVLEALAAVNEKTDPSVPELLQMCLDVGKYNLLTMQLLDEANTGKYGHPEPTEVHWAKDPSTAKPGKCILVSGHDLLELEELLKQTEGKNINVWTHGEMLPCNAYPGLKKYKHLVGHYGTAWQNQKREFDVFPGPIFMTTNCYIPAPISYVDRVYCCKPVGGVGVTHVSRCDFSPLIQKAQEMQGFAEPSGKGAKLTIGFARNAILSVAGKVVGAVKEGKLRHIFLVGGCDGFEKERNYYTEFAEKTPADCIILTLACGKFKVNMSEYGTLEGLPRLLDVGQCNDTYSALVVATELAKAFNCDVNALPLSIVLSWFEQKAVAILLTLLHLGLKNVYVGPRKPAFFTPAILDVLVEKFNLHLTGDPEADMRAMLKTS